MAEETRSGIVIAVFSTASGVGKTLVAINLAAGLSREGHRVALADLDLQFGDVAGYLQLVPERTIADAGRAVETKGDAFDVGEFLQEYRHEQVSFPVLAAPLQIDEAYNMSASAISSIVRKLRYKYDYVILDMQAAFNEINLAVLDMSTIITFLAIIDFIPAIKNLKSGCDAIRSFGYDSKKMRLVENRSGAQTILDRKDIEDLLDEPFSHALPNDYGAAQGSIDSGVPLVLSPKATKLGDALSDLVAVHTNRAVENAGSGGGGGFTGWLRRIFG